MEQLILALGWAGLYGPMALGAIGSIIGCAIAGQAAIGALLETESGHGRFIGLSAMPSSQSIYGIVVMFTLQRPITLETSAGLFFGDQQREEQAGDLRPVHRPGGHRRRLRGVRLHLRPGDRRQYSGPMSSRRSS